MAKPRTFLDIPPKARKLIYEYAGLTGRTIDLNYSNLVLYPQNEYPDSLWSQRIGCFHHSHLTIKRCEDYTTLEPYWECNRKRTDLIPIHNYFYHCEHYDCASFEDPPYSLLLASKSIFTEVFQTIYERNTFRICRSSPEGFSPLFNELGHAALQELSNLTIRLDGEPPETIVLGVDWARLEQLLPIKLHSRYGKAALSDWQNLVRRLSRCVRPNRLTLRLIAKAPDVKTAEALLEPLNQLPTLKECCIWLNQDPIEGFLDLIQKTVQRLTTRPPSDPKMPFRYLDLPQELRFRILEYTDLVSDADVEWKPSLSNVDPIPALDCSCIDELGRDTFELVGHLEGCTTKYLNDPSKYLGSPEEDFFKGIHCRYDPRCCERAYDGICDCLFNCGHAAYSSSHGKVARVHPLFLVSRQVKDDALPIFFQQNRFVVSPLGIVTPRWASPDGSHIYRIVIPMPRLELSLLLSSLSRDALRHLRWLEWVIPQFENYQQAPKSAWPDYLDTIDMMVHAMHLPKLTLVLNLRASQHEYDRTRPSWPVRYNKDGTMYDRIVGPLCRLRGLKDCFIYLRRVYKKGSENFYHSGTDADFYAFDNDEMRYEKLIMGQDYDSAKRGKPWMERSERKANWLTAPLNSYCDFEQWQY
ncbi:uncharacterized protein BDR25DRAFT_306872, partial [Lindgomyces ingoldianus]